MKNQGKTLVNIGALCLFVGTPSCMVAANSNTTEGAAYGLGVTLVVLGFLLAVVGRMLQD